LPTGTSALQPTGTSALQPIENQRYSRLEISVTADWKSALQPIENQRYSRLKISVTADWKSALQPIGNQRYSRLEISVTADWKSALQLIKSPIEYLFFKCQPLGASATPGRGISASSAPLPMLNNHLSSGMGLSSYLLYGLSHSRYSLIRAQKRLKPQPSRIFCGIFSVFLPMSRTFWRSTSL